MLKDIIKGTQLTPEFCAKALRVPLPHFQEWMEGAKPLPAYVLPELSAILGIKRADLTKFQTRKGGAETCAPAVWYKLRDPKLLPADREFVALVRRLGFSLRQLHDLRRDRTGLKWSVTAQSIAARVDRSAPPAIQGQDAAEAFRAVTSLEHGKAGIGEYLRPHLRRTGLIVIESPIPKSNLEGCCFPAGDEDQSVPCVFANSYKSTWFRRNEILLHEVCHAIFDLASDPVSLDFRGEDSNASCSQLAEIRARAFARETLAPRSVLNHYANQVGLQWSNLSATDLARLISRIHAEQTTVLQAAFEHGFIDQDLQRRYQQLDCAAELRQESLHALSTREYLRKIGEDSPKWIAEQRNTTFGIRSLRLPAGLVQEVIQAINEEEISVNKGAELLMMDRYTFQGRFGSLFAESAVA